MKPFPVLETERLLLRALAVEDAAGVLAVYGDDEVTRFSEMVTLATVEQAQTVIGFFQHEFERDAGIRWAMVEKSSSRVVGTCGFGWLRQNFSALLSYDVAREFWNRGFTTEAIRATVSHCFATTESNRISATTTVDNIASRRVLQKLGFTEEGVLRDWGFWKGQFVDLRCFSLLRKDVKV
ncbi:MAG TPA: GNAT family protein [Verrucomicrobiae bacterium]|nr:GNAT family protein [Verrucomicrobiae bacterium]